MTEPMRFSQYFTDEHFPIMVTIMPSSGMTKPFPLHSHEFSELAFVASGSVLHITETENKRLNPGDFLLIHPGWTHNYADETKDLIVYNLLYDSSVPIPMLMMSSQPFLHQVYPDQKAENFTPFTGIIHHAPISEIPLLISFLERIRTELAERKPGYRTMVISLFISLILLFARFYQNSNSNEPDWMLQKVFAFLKNHYNERITIQDLLKIAGMSESTLFRKFKAQFGIGPSEYLIELRIKNAVQLLQKSNFTIERIALECGFCDASHLWKVMKTKLQMSPAQIRKSMLKKQIQH